MQTERNGPDGKEITVMPKSCTSSSWQPTQGAGPATRTHGQGPALHWARGGVGTETLGYILQQRGANTEMPRARVSLEEAKESFFCQETRTAFQRQKTRQGRGGWAERRGAHTSPTVTSGSSPLKQNLGAGAAGGPVQTTSAGQVRGEGCPKSFSLF